MITYDKQNIRTEVDSDNKLVGLRFDLVATEGDEVAIASWHKRYDTPQEVIDSYTEDDLIVLCEDIVVNKGMKERLADVMARRKQPFIIGNPDALLVETPFDAPTDAEQRKIWMTEIDDAVAQTYTRFSRFEMEYTKREAAAVAYKDAGYTGEPTHWISRFADNTGLDYTTATNLILSQANALRNAFEQLAQLRMDKYKVQGAVTQEEALAEFNIIMNQWATINGGLK